MAIPPTREELENPLLVFPQANDMYEALVALLNDYGLRQTKAIGKCRQQISTIRSWVDTQLDLEIAL